MQVWIVLHSYERDRADEVKLIGVYSSKSNAEQAIARVRNRPGFVDHPDEFHIDPYEIDLDYWQDGFVTE